MNRITRVRLHNFCQHDSLDVQIEPGLTGILAPNGSGKTNLCRGIVYALTGLVDGLWGNQQTLQKDGTADVGWAQVDFTDGAHAYSVRRFTTSSAKFPDALVKDGKELCKRRRQVDEVMATVFGMPVALMFQTCWGRQGELAQLLMSPPALIGEFLSKVFDMKYLETIRDRLKSMMDTVVVPSSACAEQLKRDEEALASIPDPFGMKEAAEEKERELANLKKRTDELSVQALTGTSKEKLDQHMVAVNLSLAEVRTSIARGDAMANGYTTDKTEEQALSDFIRLTDTIDSVRNQLTVLNSNIAAETHSIEYIDLEERKLEDERGMVQRNCIEHEGTTCPVCGSEVPDWNVVADSTIKKMLGRFNTVSEYFEWYNREKAKLSQMRREKQTVIEVYKSKVSDFESSLETLNKLKARREQENGFFMAKYNREKERMLLDRLAELRAIPVVDDKLIKELNDVKAAMSVAEGELTKIREDIKGYEVQRTMLTEYIQRGKEAVQKYETGKAVIETLGMIRDALSQSRAQARYIKARVGVLNRALARYMRYTELPFEVRLDDDRRQFVFVTQDGFEHPAAHLSGAQRSMVAVALQMALYDMMKPNMCLYIIDEPTEPLDNNNKEIMAGMFDRMNRMVASAGGTMLIVTRDQPLIDCCTNVLELSHG